MAAAVAGWKKLRVVNDGYVYRIEDNVNGMVIFATEFTQLWQESLTSEEVLRRCEELNPLIEASSQQLMEHVNSSLENSSDLCLSKEYTYLVLKLQSKLDNLPFNWEFRLQLQSGDQFRIYFILPLLYMRKEESRIEEELCSIICKKDQEIEDYKASGARVSRHFLETRPFDRKDFMTKRHLHSETLDLDPAEIFCQLSNNLYSEILQHLLKKKERKPEDDHVEKTSDSMPDLQSATNIVTTSTKSSEKMTEEKRIEILNRLKEEEIKHRNKELNKRKRRKIL